MTFWEKIKYLFAQDTDMIADHAFDIPMIGENGNDNIIALHSHKDAHQEVVVLRPKDFNDALMTVHHLKNRSMVVVNVEAMDEGESQRLVDFISGSTFALDGSHERIGDGIFVMTPSNIGISSGAVSRSVEHRMFAQN